MPKKLKAKLGEKATYGYVITGKRNKKKGTITMTAGLKKKPDWKPVATDTTYVMMLELKFYTEMWSVTGFNAKAFKEGRMFRTKALALSEAKAIKLLLKTLPHS